MKTTTVTIQVTHPDKVRPDEILAAIEKMLDVGYADAKDTADDLELGPTAIAEAQRVLRLDIGRPHIAETLKPRTK
jgi:hypothetical protein